jgi:hypothetical protein
MKMEVSTPEPHSAESESNSYWEEIEVSSPTQVIVDNGMHKRVLKVADVLTLNYFVRRWLRHCRIDMSRSKSQTVLTLASKKRKYNCKQTLRSSSSLMYWINKWKLDELRRQRLPNQSFMKRLIHGFKESIGQKHGIRVWMYFHRNGPHIYAPITKANNVKADNSLKKYQLQYGIFHFKYILMQRHLRFNICKYILRKWKKNYYANRLVKSIYKQHLREALRRWQRRNRWPIVQNLYKISILRYISIWKYMTYGFHKRCIRSQIALGMRNRISTYNLFKKLLKLSAKKRMGRVDEAKSQVHSSKWRRNNAICHINEFKIKSLYYNKMENNSINLMKSFHHSNGLLKVVIHTARNQLMNQRCHIAYNYWKISTCSLGLLSLINNTSYYQWNTRANMYAIKHYNYGHLRWFIDSLLYTGAPVRNHKIAVHHHKCMMMNKTIISVSYFVQSKIAQREIQYWKMKTANESHTHYQMISSMNIIKKWVQRRVQLRRSYKIFKKLHPVMHCSNVPVCFYAWKIKFVPEKKRLENCSLNVVLMRNNISYRLYFNLWFDLWENGYENRYHKKRAIVCLRRLRMASLQRRSARIAKHTSRLVPCEQLIRIQRLQQHHIDHHQYQNTKINNNSKISKIEVLSRREEQRNAWCIAVYDLLDSVVPQCYLSHKNRQVSSLSQFGLQTVRMLLLVEYWAQSAKKCWQLLHLQHRFRYWAQIYTIKAKAERRQLQSQHNISAQYAAFMAVVIEKAIPMGNKVLLRRCIQVWRMPMQERDLALFRIHKRYVHSHMFKFWLELQRRKYVYRALPIATALKQKSKIVPSTKFGPPRRTPMVVDNKKANIIKSQVSAEKENCGIAYKPIGYKMRYSPPLLPSAVIEKNLQLARSVEAQTGYSISHSPTKVSQLGSRRGLSSFNNNVK